MSDLFSSMRDPEQLPTPPVEDVRRRGDSLRRRRQTLQAGGVAAVVAAVALAVVGLSGGFTNSSSPEPPIATQSSSPTPTESSAPPPSRITTIPPSFDIAQGLVDSGSDDELTQGPRVTWLGEEVVCDSDHSPADLETDRAGAVLAMPQHTTARELRVYADDETAGQVARELVGWFRDCPTFSIDGGASQTTNTVVDGDQPGSWTVLQTYTSGGQPQLGQNILLVRQIGNAVIVFKDYGEGPGATDEATMLQQVADLEESVRPIEVELSCTFGNAGGC